MKKLTAKEVLSIIENLEISVDNFAYGYFSVPDDFKLPDTLETQRKAYNDFCDLDYEVRIHLERPAYDLEAASKIWQDSIGLGEWEEIEQYGGEDQGSTWYSIKHFVDHDVYIKTDGYYQSYNGTEFEEGYGYEVFPKQKTVTVFE